MAAASDPSVLTTEMQTSRRNTQGVEALIEKLKAAGCQPFAYSGRFMFGARCVAIETAGGEYPPVAGARSDSLGKGRVWYWPEHAAPETLA